MNILEFILTSPTQKLLPQIVTVKRSTTSKYLFYLLVRHYRTVLRKHPTFLTYSKQDSNQAKGMMEEIPLFAGQDLFVLEGFYGSFVNSLNLPPDTYVVAEVDDGELEAPAYSYRMKRDLLKVLSAQLGLKIQLRELVTMDWGSVRDYPEVEVVLRKAAAAGWTVEQISEVLADYTTGNILLMLKKGNLPELLNLKSRYGEAWLHRHLIRLVPQMATYRSLVAMGQGPQAIGEELSLSNFKLREFEEAAKAVTMADLIVLAKRLIQLDRLALRKPGLASDLLVLKSGISIKR